MKNLRDKKWSIKKGIVMKKECIYVPEENLRREIIHLYHNTLVGGHGGRWKIVELVTRNYWWLGAIKKVERYIDGYDTC